MPPSIRRGNDRSEMTWMEAPTGTKYVPFHGCSAQSQTRPVRSQPGECERLTAPLDYIHIYIHIYVYTYIHVSPVACVSYLVPLALYFPPHTHAPSLNRGALARPPSREQRMQAELNKYPYTHCVSRVPMHTAMHRSRRRYIAPSTDFIQEHQSHPNGSKCLLLPVVPITTYPTPAHLSLPDRHSPFRRPALPSIHLEPANPRPLVITRKRTAARPRCIETRSPQYTGISRCTCIQARGDKSRAGLILFLGVGDACSLLPCSRLVLDICPEPTGLVRCSFLLLPFSISCLPPHFFNFGQCAFSFVPSSYFDWKQRATLLPPGATKQLSRHPSPERIFPKADLALPASPPA